MIEEDKLQLAYPNNQSKTDTAKALGIKITIQPSFVKNIVYLLFGFIIIASSISYTVFYSQYQFFLSEDLLQMRRLSNNQSVHANPLPPQNVSLDQKIEKIMSKSNKKSSPRFKPTPLAYLSYFYYLNAESPQCMQIQKYYYNKKYEIRKYAKNQLPICIISAGRNVAFQDRYLKFLASIKRQQYSNYKLVIIDDNSDDGSQQKIKQALQDPFFYSITSKIKYFSNTQRKYALFSRDYGISTYCHDQDIILQVDTDDQLIGTQALQLINSVYSKNPEIWVMYSSYIYWNPFHGEPTQGISQKVSAKILQQGTYRDTTQWYSSAARTYRKKLYDKIDKTDFMDQNGTYFQWTSDLFVHYSLIELSGREHYKFIGQVFYYYYLDHNSVKLVQKCRSRMKSLWVRPYKALLSLDGEVQRKERSISEDWIREESEKCKKKGDDLQ